MSHENKNPLLTLYYGEGSEREREKIRAHVASCNDCQEYMRFLKKADIALGYAEDERPPADTLEIVMTNIASAGSPAAATREVQSTHGKSAVAVQPFLRILFSICAIIGLLSFITAKFNASELWRSLAQYQPLQSIGSFGVVCICFFLFGTFFSLAIFPTLYFNAQKMRDYAL